jgi:hypothetical protein
VSVHLTAAQARALGITGVAPAKVRTTRKEATGPYRTRCATPTCHVEFSTMTNESSHFAATGHCRYDLIIEEQPP